ncbi:MAG: CBS domain-containing protein [Chloroflexi bacterium]|nr:CBS domain-containing protein [Chloroflexota bacterium]
MFVQDAMTPNPVAVSPNASVLEISELLQEHRFRRVPVVDDDGHLVGIVSQRDVLAASPAITSTLPAWERRQFMARIKARFVMSRPVLAVTRDCPIEEASRILLERKFGSLPVVEEGKLVGIITETDIFRTLVNMLSGGNEPGMRLLLRVEREKGVVSRLTALVNEHGGRVIAIATLNEPDGKHKQVLIKEEGADVKSLYAALEAEEVEVLDARERRKCTVVELP